MSGNDILLFTPEARVKALADKSVVEVNPGVKVIQYVRTAKQLIRTADTYYDDHNCEAAYLLYMRYLTLSLEKLKTHPGYKDVPDEDKREMRTTCKRVLSMAEKVKTELLVQYQREYAEALRQKKLEDEKLEAERKRLEQNRTSSTSFSPVSASSQSFTSSHRSASPGGNTTLASSATHSIPSASALKGVNYDYNVISDTNILNGSRAKPNSSAQQPQFDRRSKPSRFQTPMGTDSLRTVIIPGDLISKFTSLASTNTSKNIETCGVLCGKVIRDQLVITHLVIPKQTGTPDSCTTLNEEEIYNIIDKYSLIQLGWIHTHPTQTSFLSSVDLHSQLPYQLMLAESIAIVVSPSKQECNVFTLTGPGMEALQKCVDSGFHPHHQLDEPYFVDASHAFFESTRYIIVEDLRH